MESFESQLNKERELYRELFINAEKAFKDIINSMKSDFSCSECKTCCQLRYSQLPPEEIFKLAKYENETISKEYIKFFIPYGFEKDYKYSETQTISTEENNKTAKNTLDQAGSAYVKKIIAKHTEPVYFYRCRFLTKDKKCSFNGKCPLQEDFPNSITTILPNECAYRNWQNQVINKIQTEIAPDIEQKSKQIKDYRYSITCKQTGTCCRLASSEFTYEELKQKAQNNDKFAKQFTSIFVPYESYEDARNVFPEYVDLVRSRLGEGEKINFYYCKHLVGENICPIYEDRPQICRDFPDDPLAILPPICAFCEWKEEVSVAAHTLHAMKQIYGFYLQKIVEAIS